VFRRGLDVLKPERHHRSQAGFHLDVLSVLLMGGGLPSSILAVHADAIQEVLRGGNGLDQALGEATIDMDALQGKIEEGRRWRRHISK
jgi:hypothetical protein